VKGWEQVRLQEIEGTKGEYELMLSSEKQRNRWLSETIRCVYEEKIDVTALGGETRYLMHLVDKYNVKM
jgi:hypothetical protein